MSRIPRVGELVQCYDRIDGMIIPGKVVPVVMIQPSSYWPETHSFITVEFPDGHRYTANAYDFHLLDADA